MRLNNRERALWVLNDEHLYKWQKDSGLHMAIFIRKYKAEIDAYIKSAISHK